MCDWSQVESLAFLSNICILQHDSGAECETTMGSSKLSNRLVISSVIMPYNSKAKFGNDMVNSASSAVRTNIRLGNIPVRKH